MAAAMAGPRAASDARHLFGDDDAADRLTPFTGQAVESDVDYFRRRSEEERRASNEAAHPEARLAHRELAARYARLSPRTAWPHGLAPQYHPFAARAWFMAVLRRRFGRPSRDGLPYPDRLEPLRGFQIPDGGAIAGDRLPTRSATTDDTAGNAGIGSPAWRRCAANHRR
jgi:hypothetical protein